MRTKKKSGKKSNGLFIAALIVLFILVILVLFLVNKDQIFTNLKQTDFFGKVFGATPQLIEKHEVKPKDTEIPLKEDIVININEEQESAPEIQKEQKLVNEPVNDVEKETTTEKVEEQSKTEQKKEEKKQPASTMQVELCFVEVDADGTVVRKFAKRTVPKGDSPLTTAINLLLEGPDPLNKKEKNYMTLIPKDTKLLGARVSDGVAYLNFSEEFEFTWGVEGAIHQLEQVVYTATAFSTVNKVQFLIEGKKREYLGSEGQWIGSPLSRADF